MEWPLDSLPLFRSMAWQRWSDGIAPSHSQKESNRYAVAGAAFLEGPTERSGVGVRYECRTMRSEQLLTDASALIVPNPDAKRSHQRRLNSYRLKAGRIDDD